MNIEEVLYLPVKREGLNIGPDEFDCKHRYRTLDGEEVVTSFKAKSEDELADQPKPKVPQFVADWYEKHKDSLEYCIWEYITEWDNQEKDDFFDFMNYSTFKPIQTLVNMHQFGYSIQKEKLYTVEIPNPNDATTVTYLSKNSDGKVEISGTYFFDCAPNSDWREEPETQLTEQEIRKDFEWAWQFREEVTE
ncbi:DUF1642 domain-containing protein [Streptococcus agalactiae]|uniref:DUF1642 domain-containing protein n=1 Tax=Streptococcus agalactiae TaxID=1311 RepID=UPI0002B92A42|nr:DUF1642 domain-containing protein [Streptococcus agalactiae]EPU45472.1 hypothetical protein SAG0170_07505 [Streptococcus agalactiae LDS 617]